MPPAGGVQPVQVASTRPAIIGHRPLVASPRGTHKIQHTVKRGDTLWHIARAYNINWRDILRWNGKQGSRLVAGQRLVLYVPSAKAEGMVDTQPTATTPSNVIYVVKPGDNLWAIGRRYGVTPDQLRRWNGLSSNDLNPGDKLTVKRDDS